MDFLQTLAQRNAAFADSDFSADLKIIPSRKTMIIGCVDPRVDPMDVLQLQPGEAAVIRNVGGRVNPALLETMAILRTVSRVGGSEVGEGWNLILLHHTDCGITGCLHHAPELLAKHMGVTPQELAALEIDDPYKAVAVDVAALKANPNLPGGFTVSGLVYDVATGRIDTVVPAGPLRSE
ncbi:carbonic anhydrase [Pseudomonas sp. NFX224]|uniref:carbonic anhydrase n=1 Tax=Pseudomonas sp. NFX224 TaxID=3402862 RepID=UPI003AFB6FAE